MTQETRFEIDHDLHAVMEWMQQNVPAGRLVAVCSELARLGPLCWGSYQPEAIQALRLVAPRPSSAAAGKPAASSE